MSSKTLYISGVAQWAKFKTPDPKYGHYSLDFYPNAEGLEIFMNEGLRLEPRIKDDKTFYKLRRPHQKMIKDELVVFGPPKVVIATGEVDEQGIPKTEPYDGLVGNGSEVTVRLTVYDTPGANKWKGHRLESVRIENLVEYVPQTPIAERDPTVEYPF